MKTDGARSPDAQLKAMAAQWPDFQGRRLGDGTLAWRGPLRPKAGLYEVFLFWKPGAMTLPYVMVIDPPLEPRPGSTFAEIPHLIYDANDPPSSGLCLFDPEGGEWSAARLIAETTIHWTAEWLAYYELWHLTGEWLAPGVGYESVARMHAADAQIIREVKADVH
ncbi:MAG: hypothetical protein CMN87_04570 [Stappia sp.]|uniref:hypothetical protein n=1 Tax=Stappia sp. TaxID=1870903 RepID=UPI000C5A768E|nr:hypothetical protein [Stappia sp.]MAB00286.1 hypothetical protein [Stappia sp.]MBM19265.1 hypothetical protein [Stappia sp.]